jgi:hypothetical protein
MISRVFFALFPTLLSRVASVKRAAFGGRRRRGAGRGGLFQTRNPKTEGRKRSEVRREYVACVAGFTLMMPLTEVRAVPVLRAFDSGEDSVMKANGKRGGMVSRRCAYGVHIAYRWCTSGPTSQLRGRGLRAASRSQATLRPPLDHLKGGGRGAGDPRTPHPGPTAVELGS